MRPFIFLFFIVFLVCENPIFAQKSTKEVYVIAGFDVDGFCAGDSTKFTNTSQVIINGQNYPAVNLHWFFGDSTDTRALENPIHIYDTALMFNVKLIVRYQGAKDSIIKPITIKPQPTLTIKADGPTTIFNGTTRKLTAEGNFTSCLWTNNSTEKFIVISAKGTYKVTVKDANNCKNSDSIQIFVKNPDNGKDFFSINVLNNILTPNGDGINDVLFVDSIESYLSPIELTVYNRWGDLIYSSSNYKNDWNGVDSSGNALESGTYYFALRNKERRGRTGYIDVLP